MTNLEKVQSWRWRIVKADYNYQNFANELGISKQVLSHWINGRNKPSAEKIDLIEARLKELGV